MVPTDRDGDDTAQLLTGLPDERRVEDRDDVLTFTSDPLGSPLDLAGLIRLSGSVGSSHTSMQLVLKLIDVLPSGRARAIAERAVHVDDVHPERHVDVDIGFAGYRVGEGHSVRLEVASSAFPKYIWHPGTDEDPWTAITGTPNEQFIRVGGRASFLEVTFCRHDRSERSVRSGGFLRTPHQPTNQPRGVLSTEAYVSELR